MANRRSTRKTARKSTRKTARKAAPRNRQRNAATRNVPGVAAMPKIGSRFLVPRTLKPFYITVEGINAKSISGRDAKGRKWRVPYKYLDRQGAKLAKPNFRGEPRAPRMPRTRRPWSEHKGGEPGNPDTWSEAETARRGYGPAGTGGSSKRNVAARIEQIVNATPRRGDHFMNGKGGDGFSGYLWMSIPRVMKKGIIMNTNGKHSAADLKDLEARLKREFPTAHVRMNVD